GLHVEAKVRLRVVAFRGGHIGAVRDGFSGEQAHPGVVPALGDVVADLELVLPSADLACSPCREVIGEREDNFGAEGLQQRAPSLARQDGLEGTNALRRDNGNALGLPGEAEKLLVTSGLVLADSGEVLI